MGASFEEKSVWVQLGATALGLGAYFVVAGRMLAAGVRELPAYAALFIVSTIAIVVLLVAGHVVAALSGRAERRDERDRLISWRAESNSSWLLAVGVLGGVAAMVLGVGAAWVANGLLLSLFLSEALGLALRIVYYRRGL